MPQDLPTITAQQLCKTFPAPGCATRIAALDGISFSVNPYEVLGVVGKSGAGKTTLLRVLSLQIPPDRGTLDFAATRIEATTSAPIRREVIRRTATVFQGFSLLYNRSVLDNVALPLKLRGLARHKRLRRAAEMLEFVGLGARATAWPITLSGGEAQRVTIARALITDPEILFLDEPTSALDAETSLGILDLLKQVQSRSAVAMILVAHQLSVVRYMCDRVLHLEDGRLRHLGPIQKAAVFPVDSLEPLWPDHPAGVPAPAVAEEARHV
jgi:D-methionine transport system ATP-binding protein